MRVEEVVGDRLRRERERAGLSQAQVGQYVAPLLGRVLPRQAISHAEAGKRAFTAAELVAFAHVIGCDVAKLLELPPHVDAVTMPSGRTLDRDQFPVDESEPVSLKEWHVVLGDIMDITEEVRRLAEVAFVEVSRLAKEAGRADISDAKRTAVEGRE